MRKAQATLFAAVACIASLACVSAADPPDLPLIDLSTEASVARFVPSTASEVTVARAEGMPGVVVTCRPGKDSYPGISLKPEGAYWDLSAYGHADLRVTNVGAVDSGISLRIDNEGDWQTNPWSTECVWFKPGQSGVVRVRFGYSWGKPGFKLDPAKVNQLLVFANKSDREQSFRIEGIIAAGVAGEKPPVNPADVRTKPVGGVLLGKGTSLDAATQLAVQGGAKAELVTADGGQSVRVTIPDRAAQGLALVKPAVGAWDLRDWLEVKVRIRNDGAVPFKARARLDSQGRTGNWVDATEPLAPGAEQEITLPFAGDMVVLAYPGGPKSGGTNFESDRAGGVAVGAVGAGERILTVLSLQASVPPVDLPDWLGKRPPVEGDWTLTMDESFDGPELDMKRWTIYHPNYWDKRSHFSKDNVILSDGLLRLRFEKKRGHADDDPAKPETDWATGFITSTHKWTQRYGYFECRMKLPSAPGMWPAFWMMPDRGEAAGAARESTSNGGMEFDILEYLSRYGPYRYNIAFHWDDYGKDHKSIGTERIYFRPDADGFVTAGLLWEPGRATYYVGGQAVAQWTDPRVASVPEYILFTAVSGGWGGNDLTGEGLPDDYVLDYVRVWQRADWAEAK
jgi:beta-glucanase (GH16 family)